jgi:hypothetical protein
MSLATLTSPCAHFLGGPGTVLPRRVESLLSWSLALSCLLVSGYHYLVETYVKPQAQWILHRLRTRCGILCPRPHEPTGIEPTFPCWLPLMTYTRAELDRATPMERWVQMVALLRTLQRSNRGNGSRDNDSIDGISDDELVDWIRGHEILRRLVSLAMRPHTTAIRENVPHLFLQRQIVRIWPRLLSLPTVVLEDDNFSQSCDISLIVPCYKELVSDIAQKLSYALDHCAKPQRVQLIIVWAGPDAPHIELQTMLSLPSPTTNESGSSDQCRSSWCKVDILHFYPESGRGPCLNFGATRAIGRILCFCHSDTKLPHHWDAKIWHTLQDNKAPRSNACAFGFGIDANTTLLPGIYSPPGIRAVEATANLRCRLWSLPYADQCLSMRTKDFWYLGGFPHQCFMEDYELVALLRRRTRLLPKFRQSEDAGLPQDEVLTIVPGAPALCSPRRWQKYGVLYVTFTNSKLVNLYARGTSPDELYRLYYGQSLPIIAPVSPWELELQTLLGRQSP